MDLILQNEDFFANQDVQVVFLGSGRGDLQDQLMGMQERHHHKIRAWIGFSNEFAHRLTAGADILMMPSRFEPCGLNQLYAMHYGTVPVVHEVGGLRDTVRHYDGMNDGTCIGGRSDGQSCDAQSGNTTFPAPAGGRNSLDCLPNTDLLISGLGIRTRLDIGTGDAQQRLGYRA